MVKASVSVRELQQNLKRVMERVEGGQEAIYVTEAFSRATRPLVRTAQVPFTQLHDLELGNALERLVGLRAITRDECWALVSQFKDDVKQGRLIVRRLDLDQTSCFTLPQHA